MEDGSLFRDDHIRWELVRGNDPIISSQEKYRDIDRNRRFIRDIYD